ncbi:MAG: MOSC domain-containing protein [Rhodobacteraceae bacterium]|nr:MOSC domain-containing protein [Paracoccaceae bacterium]
MLLTSANIAEPSPIKAKSGLTGIFKRPQTAPVMITAQGLAGDAIIDRANHGSPEQAVYLYGQLDYDWWEVELGQPLPSGTFGENLTIAGISSADMCIGDQIEIGPVLLELTWPRIPCVTLAARMADTGFVRRFHRAQRPGAYARVLRSGAVQAGMAVQHRRISRDALPLLSHFPKIGP